VEKLSDDRDYAMCIDLISKYAKVDVEKMLFLDRYKLMQEVIAWNYKCKNLILPRRFSEFRQMLGDQADIFKQILKTSALAECFSKRFKLWEASIRMDYLFSHNETLDILHNSHKEFPVMKKFLKHVDIYDRELKMLHRFNCNFLKYIKIYLKNRDRKRSKV